MTFEARANAIRRYAAAYDRAAEEEQVAVAMGDDDRAEAARQDALIVLRAYRAELDDPTPRVCCTCAVCALAMQFRRLA